MTLGDKATGKNLTGVGVQFATHDQKNATQVQNV